MPILCPSRRVLSRIYLLLFVTFICLSVILYHNVHFSSHFWGTQWPSAWFILSPLPLAPCCANAVIHLTVIGLLCAIFGCFTPNRIKYIVVLLICIGSVLTALSLVVAFTELAIDGPRGLRRQTRDLVVQYCPRNSKSKSSLRMDQLHRAFQCCGETDFKDFAILVSHKWTEALAPSSCYQEINSTMTDKGQQDTWTTGENGQNHQKKKEPAEMTMEVGLAEKGSSARDAEFLGKVPGCSAAIYYDYTDRKNKVAAWTLALASLQAVVSFIVLLLGVGGEEPVVVDVAVQTSDIKKTDSIASVEVSELQWIPKN